MGMIYKGKSLLDLFYRLDKTLTSLQTERNSLSADVEQIELRFRFVGDLKIERFLFFREIIENLAEKLYSSYLDLLWILELDDLVVILLHILTIADDSLLVEYHLDEGAQEFIASGLKVEQMMRW